MRAWLTGWLRKKNPLAQLLTMRKVQSLLGSDLKTEVQARVPFEDVAKALEQYTTQMTRGKVLLVPHPL